MTKAIIIIILVLLFIVGGMVTLLNSANQKIPDNYDKSKVGFDDEEDDWPSAKDNGPNVSQDDQQDKDR
ncbi:MAG: DUF2897 family protein [Kangiellaceae bacterium]|nr:DUF2897 family protein [Kangiellaceae bacterium]MCW9015330.1 DUF2897 family protein [Kangiellaceae bacterium]